MSAIYLHFLDRELRESVGLQATDELLHRALAAAFICTNSYLYCSLSFIFETCVGYPGLAQFVSEMLRLGHLHAVSDHPTVSDFLDSRRRLYAHDKDRYPSYFGDAPEKFGGTVKPVYKGSSATAALKRGITHRCNDREDSLVTGRPVSDGAVHSLLCGIDSIGARAVTFSAFREHVLDLSSAVPGEIRRVISEEYTRHYLDLFGGVIMTGVTGLSYYDNLCRGFPRFDCPVLVDLVEKVFGWKTVLEDNGRLLSPFVTGRGSEDHIAFCNLVSDFIAAIEITAGIPAHAAAWQSMRQNLIAQIRALNGFPNRIPDNPYLAGSGILQQQIDARAKQDIKFRETFAMAKDRREFGGVKVVVATATDLEDDIFWERAKALGLSATVVPGRNGVYQSFGTIGSSELLLVRSRMGITGPNASELTTQDAIDDLLPDYVISCGIAFGKGTSKQAIGDVLVSEWVRLYEKQRVGETTTIPRGERVPACGALLQLAGISRLGLEGFRVHTGGMMSGDKLVDQGDLKKAIFEIEPEAIGGDMEGGGIVSASQRRNVGWVVVKAICDWGEDKNNPSRDKDEDQKLAARNAIGFVLRMLTQGMLPKPARR